MKGKLAAGAAAGVIALAATIVKPWEGYKTQPYRDIVGVWTVCYGSTGNVIPERRYTDAECQERLQTDLGKHLVGVQQCVHRPLAQNEWAAVLSLSYNAGVGAICASTMVRLINAGAPPEVWCQQFDRWVYAGGKRVRGLVNRRAAEKAVCLGAAE